MSERSQKSPKKAPKIDADVLRKLGERDQKVLKVGTGATASPNIEKFATKLADSHELQTKLGALCASLQAATVAATDKFLRGIVAESAAAGVQLTEDEARAFALTAFSKGTAANELSGEE